jgi:hypothetical protein
LGWLCLLSLIHKHVRIVGDRLLHETHIKSTE